MVASDGGFDIRLSPDLVSIPFIAGQWSLQIEARAAAEERAKVSIPFIAGQWSLRIFPPSRGVGAARVSIPFIAGQWSLHVVAAVAAMRL